MKKFLLFGFLMLAGSAFAQPPVQTPPLIYACDVDNDFVELVDLTVNEFAILGSLNPANYNISYYVTQADAENAVDAITVPNTYFYTGEGTGVYVRVESVTDSSDFAVVNQGIVLGFVPVASTPPNLTVYENPSDGIAQFNLTQVQPFVNSNPAYQFSYFVSQIDAVVNANPIANPAAFINSGNPQTIWVRVTDAVTGCWNGTSFQISVQGGTDTIVNIPDANFLAAIIADGFDLNNDGQIQTGEASFIQVLDVHSNNISDLTGINHFPNLTYLNAMDNQIAAVNIVGLQHLGTLNLSDNEITDVFVDNLPVLSVFYIRNNQFEDLDVSGLPGLGEIDLEGNANLERLNVKNGVPGQMWIGLGVVDTTSLEYLCADEDDLTAYYNTLTGQYGMELYVSSYCTFEPSGIFNTISGIVTIDANGNGCDATDAGQSFVKLKVSLNGVYLGSAFTTANGNYSAFATVPGIYTIMPELENPAIFNITPGQADVNVAAINSTTTTQNFCLTPNGTHPDLEVVVAPTSNAQPGFDATYRIVYKNKGNQTLSGAVIFTYDDNRLDFVNAAPATSASSSGSLTWNFVNLKPFEHNEIEVKLNLNGPMETPAINLGDILTYSVAITPSTGDDTPADNAFMLNQTVIGSYDPNNVICLEGANVSPLAIGQYLHYVVNFENTGTAAATFIAVRHDINPADYDIASLQVMGSSHPAVTSVNGNKVEFYFDNINLGASDHGNILFKIRSRNTLQANDSVLNKANIFFDYNFPIETNDAVTTFQLLSRNDFGQAGISIYPNPTRGIVTINSVSAIQKVELYDIQGRLLQTQDGASQKLDLSGRAKGIYFVKIANANGIKTEKIVLE